MELLATPPQRKQVEHLIRIPFGRRARWKRTKKSIRRRLADLRGGINPRIGIVDRHPQKSRRTKPQQLLRPWTEGAQRSLVEAKRGFKLRPGNRVLNLVDQVRELQAAAGHHAL